MCGMDKREEILREWIAKNFKPFTRTQVNQYIPDFMVRRLLKKEIGLDVSQEEYAKAMLGVGFIGRQTKSKEWIFNISDAEYKSAFRRIIG